MRSAAETQFAGSVNWRQSSESVNKLDTAGGVERDENTEVVRNVVSRQSFAPFEVW